jgi:hypothetical protein
MINRIASVIAAECGKAPNLGDPDGAQAQKHPAYSDGYFDGLNAMPMQGGQHAAYEVGYMAGAAAADLFEDCGFERCGDGTFSKHFAMRKGDDDV